MQVSGLMDEVIISIGKPRITSLITARSAREITASEHSSSPVNFEGVTGKSVLEVAGIVFGESMKGKRMTECLVVEAADGYQGVFAMAELDPAFSDKQIVLAFSRDGKTLGDKEGPYRIVVPDEKRMARWVRQITTIKVVNVQ